MNVQAIIFDVDGVLLDTVQYHFKAWKQLFNNQGRDFTFEDYIEKVNGLPRLTGIKNIMPYTDSTKLEELASQKQDMLVSLVTKNPPKPLPGVISLFKKLRKRGLKLAAASSSKNAKGLLEKAGLSKYLDTIIGGEDFSNPKPNPELFILASLKLNIHPKNCVVVEDAFLGIQAAQNARMKTIGLLSSKDTNIKKFADLSINSLQDYASLQTFIEQNTI